jgi:tRNA(fMet)-specific endonuclease VapC
MYLIDTNILCYLMQKNQSVIDNFEKYQSQIFLCSVIQAECEFGAHKKSFQKLLQFYEILFDNYGYIKFGKKESSKFAKLKSDLQKSGISIEDFDLMISSIALANNLILVSHNTKHFQKIPDLVIVDWSV